MITDQNIENTADAGLIRLKQTVIDGGYCIGCGACAYIQGPQIKIEFDEYGCYKAKINTADDTDSFQTDVLDVCPFSEKSINEDKLGQELFGKDCAYHNKIGYFYQTLVGYVLEGDFRENGSSGGFGTWIVLELFRQNLIDGVLHIRERDNSDANSPIFSYKASLTENEIESGAKSRYYPVEMSQVLNFIRDNPGRYAIVGIPCFIKAVRLLAKKDKYIKERIKYCIGIVCGHLKSKHFADMFAWQCGIEPRHLVSINFRKKIEKNSANLYGIEVTGRQGTKEIKRYKVNNEFYGHDWGQGFFKYNACDYCDDVLAETADIAIGDAWLPQYIADSKGTNIIVIRNKEIAEICRNAYENNRISYDPATPEMVAESQNAGLRHRREGLAFRLYLKDQGKLWRPIKRVNANDKLLDERQKRIQEVRISLVDMSHKAFQIAYRKRDFNLFINQMFSLVREYHNLYTPVGFKMKMKRVIKKLLGHPY